MEKRLETLSIEGIRQYYCLTLGTNQFYHLDNDFFWVLGCHVFGLELDYVSIGNVTIICTEGWARCDLEGEVLELRPQSIMEILHRNHIRIVESSEDFRFNLFTMSETFSASLHVDNPIAVYMRAQKKKVFRYDDRSWQDFLLYERLIVNTLRWKDNPYRRQIIRRLIEAEVLQCNPQAPEDANASLRTGDLTQRFIHLLQLEYTRHHDIPFYAGRLCVTPKYLSECIKKACGSTAGQMIERMITHEAEQMLKSTNLSVMEICTRLGFEDPSAFGKYFKRVKGVSPKNYRDNLNKE